MKKPKKKPQVDGMESRGGNSTQLLGAIKMSRNSEIIIHTPSAVGSQETQDMAVDKRGTQRGAKRGLRWSGDNDEVGPHVSILCDLFCG